MLLLLSDIGQTDTFIYYSLFLPSMNVLFNEFLWNIAVKIKSNLHINSMNFSNVHSLIVIIQMFLQLTKG